MKKKFLYATIAAVSLTAGLYLSQSEKKSNLSDLLTENVEALADEITKPKECPGGTVLCAFIHYPGGSVTYYEKNGTPTPQPPPTPLN